MGRWSAVGVAMLAMAAVLVPFGNGTQSRAAAGDGTLTVTVIRDVNADGVRTTQLEPGLAGVSVVITDAAGASATVLTNATGFASFDGATSTLTGGQYRVEVKNPSPGVLHPAFANPTNVLPSATSLSSNEEFVDLRAGTNVSMLTGFWNPGDYCQANPTIYSACQPGLNSAGTAFVNDGGRALYSTAYRVAPTNAVANVNTLAQVGAVYGIGLQRGTGRVFQAAYAKRGSQYGPAGAGGIYVTTAAGTTTTFVDVPDSEMGTTLHALTETGPLGLPVATQDIRFTPVVGTESWGDIDVSDDGKWLFAVNQFTKQLYIWDATVASTTSAAATKLAIPNQCPTPVQWRPMGLGERDGLLYIGGVCSVALTAQVTTMTIGDTLAGMSMTSNNVLNQSLAYSRPTNTLAVGAGCGSATWRAWANAMSTTCATFGAVQVTFPQPMVGDIEFRTDGRMMVSLRDRGGDQYGFGLYASIGAANTIPQYVSSGDLLMACAPTGTTTGYVFDVNGNTCGTSSSEFFRGDPRYPDGLYPGGFVHTESYFSGIVYVPTEVGVVTNVIDPLNVAFTGGITNTNVFTQATISPMDNSSETATSLRTMPNSSPGGFGKGQGLADIEALCNFAPLQIGNRVWFDRDRDGVQDAGEIPLEGVTVQLIRNGSVIGTRTTNARGEYYFSTADANLGGAFLPDGGDYTIDFVPPTTGNVNLGPDVGSRPWSTLQFTSRQVGSNTHVDSNADPANGTYVYTAGGPGEDDHTIDAGLIIPPPVPQFSKVSDPPPGTAVLPGQTITYTVTTVNPSNAEPIVAATLTDDTSGVLDKTTMTSAPALTCSGGAPGATCGTLVFTAGTGALTWSASAAVPLSPATTATITYTVTVASGATGDVVNHLVEPDITVEHPILSYGKTAVPAAGTLVSPGEQVTYDFWVKNTGTVATTTPTTVTDDVADVVGVADIDAASVQATTTPAGTAVGTAAYNAAAETVSWTGNLVGGQEVHVTFDATIRADAFGEIRNRFFDVTVVHPISAAVTWRKVSAADTAVALGGSEWTWTPLAPAGPAIAVQDCREATAADCTGPDTDPSAGGFRLERLVPGDYELVETRAPIGYVLDATPRTVTVVGTAAVTDIGLIENTQQGVPTLPLTGGLGSDHVVLAGLGVMLLAACGGGLHWRLRRRVVT